MYSCIQEHKYPNFLQCSSSQIYVDYNAAKKGLTIYDRIQQKK
jgi:hypothetical protein